VSITHFSYKPYVVTYGLKNVTAPKGWIVVER
jgi:hypothetical protein